MKKLIVLGGGDPCICWSYI